MKSNILLGFSLFYLLPVFCKAQIEARAPTPEDYRRAVSFQWQNLVNKKVFNVNVQPVWCGDSTGLGFVTQNRERKYFNKVDFGTTKIQPWFDQERIAKLLSDSTNQKVNAGDLALQNLNYKSSEQLEFNFQGKRYALNLLTHTLKVVNLPANNPLESRSPDGKWIAFTRDYNLYIRSTADGTERPLSRDGKRLFEFGTYYGWSDIIEGENGERPARLFTRWSPDSKWIQTYLCDMRIAKKMYLLDWSVDTLYKPRLLSYYRGSPGDSDMVRMIPVFYQIETGEAQIKSHLQSTHTNPIDYEWSKESGIVYQKNAIRGYQAVELHRCDLNRNTEELIYRETSTTNIDNYSSGILEDLSKVLITSERSGWKQLYLLDLKTKALEPLTQGPFYVNQVLHVDRKYRQVLFTASGREAGRNPYHQFFYAVGLDDRRIRLLTPQEGNHDITISPDGKWVVDNVSTLDRPTITLLRRASTGTSLIELSRAEISALDSAGLKLPETFTATGRDGQTVLYGAIWKPSRFDPAKKYPVIDQSYTGPHTFMYPRNFISGLARSNHALAELGFIVFTVDGMGTANRSKAFHNVSYKNMGKNLEDHRLAILQLGRQYPWIDTTRVGIFGHSAGGFDAGHAVMEYPDFYKVAVASSADHDFRMEKDWWPEMYMGWPVDSTYHQVSNITLAGNLKGKLLITHGGIDENVNPSATFKLAEALIRANKEFDMLILPSQRHGYQGVYNDYFTKKKWNYFVEHLLGGEPIWDIDMKGK